MILKQNCNYMIRRMMGTSTIKIFINEFGKLFALLFGEFALINVLSFFILVKQESVTKWKVLGDIIKFDGYFLIILLGIGIISCLFIRLVGHVKYLNSHNQLSKLYYIQAIIKVIITVVLLVPFVNAYNYGKPYLINYLNVRAMKDEVGNLYSIDFNPEKSKEIFYEYIDKAVYCDFQTYFDNVDTLRYDDVSKDDVYPYGDKESSIDIILENADRLEHKVKSFLYLNRLDYLQGEDNELATFAIKELIEKIVSQMDLLKPNIHLETELEDVTFVGDEEHWRVAIENIIENASRYAKTLIKITLKEDYLEIYNDGEAIDEATLPYLFDPYVKGVKGQFGLGLSIVSKIASMFGYNVSAVNQEVGVCFIFQKAK